mmetsp:Transcript_9904/g.23592  ORF Transcript_9904/g.23592 Transcript_9904/m.23592 type:complete len:212 (-) Transcript_9904:152-787(-)
MLCLTFLRCSLSRCASAISDRCSASTPTTIPVRCSRCSISRSAAAAASKARASSHTLTAKCKCFASALALALACASCFWPSSTRSFPSAWRSTSSASIRLTTSSCSHRWRRRASARLRLYSSATRSRTASSQLPSRRARTATSHAAISSRPPPRVPGRCLSCGKSPHWMSSMVSRTRSRRASKSALSSSTSSSRRSCISSVCFSGSTKPTT